MPSNRTQEARERAAEIIEALDEQDITWHSQGPWEHLGDACRDGRLMADDVLFLAARVSTLETALRAWWNEYVTKECACKEVHLLNLCPHCSADELLRLLAHEIAALAEGDNRP